MSGIGVYCRVSTDEQAKEGTIENQIEYAKKYFELNKIKNFKWYLDDGVSGTIPLEERPKGKELLLDAEKGNLKILYVYKIDRLGRITRITLNALYELEQRGVAVKSMTEPFDTNSPAGRYFVTNLAAMAALDRENIIQRLNDGKDRSARYGKWVNGIVPYGYILNDEQKIEPYEPEAKVVQMIYQLVTEYNYGTTNIANYLNMLGISTVSNGKGKRRKTLATIWTNARVRNLIHLKVYKGKYTFRTNSKLGREPIVSEVPALVSEETWNKAVEILREHQRWSDKNKRYKYLLSGLIKCGICGMTFLGSTTILKKKYITGYYRCGGKVSYRGKFYGKCPNRNLRQKDIELEIWEKCKQIAFNPEEYFQEVTAGMGNYLKEAQGEIAVLEKGLKDKEKERQKILELYRKEIISQEDVVTQLEIINKEKEQAEIRIQEIKKEIARIKEYQKTQKNMEALLNRIRDKMESPTFTFEEKQAVIRAIIKEIIVYPNDTKIVYLLG